MNAEAATAHLFTGAWTDAHGRNTKAATGMRLYRLGELIAPAPPPPGAARQAGVADTDLIAQWFTAFQAETGGPPADQHRSAATRIELGTAVLWEDDGPAAVACCWLPFHGVARIAPVYTPPARRGHGYGGAVTAAIVQRARELDAQEVVLFADLANPTSNALYQRLGFRPVADFAIREMC
ncbi:GNAT family N-acetyltransferase [Nocardia sp. IFM 10818]